MITSCLRKIIYSHRHRLCGSGWVVQAEVRPCGGIRKVNVAELVAALGIDNAQNSPSDAQSERWDINAIDSIKQQLDDRDVQVMSELFAWAEVNKLRRWWGSGKGSGSCFFQADIEGAGRHTFTVWTSGSGGVQFLLSQAPGLCCR